MHLLDLAERGLKPKRTIADGGSGLRAGQAEAWPDVPCNGDVFHAERDLGMLANYLANRASHCTTTREKLERKMERCKKKGQGKRRFSLARVMAKLAGTSEAVIMVAFMVMNLEKILSSGLYFLLHILQKLLSARQECCNYADGLHWAQKVRITMPGADIINC